MVHHELTGKMDWSLIRWIKEEVLVGENSFLHTNKGNQLFNCQIMKVYQQLTLIDQMALQ